MTVSIANTQVLPASGLSDRGRLVLAFVDGGTEWLGWAMGDVGAHRSFPDESALVASVQQGLHGSNLALLPRLGLLVSPVKLITLTSDELRILAKAESSQDPGALPAQLSTVLANQGLLTQADLGTGTAFLDELGVSREPVFQAMGFEDRLAVYGLLGPAEAQSQGQGVLAPALQREAAAFAVKQARTPLEFVDYYRAYLQLAAKPGAPADALGRQTLADGALETLLPMLFGVLDCPRVDGLVAPSAVAAAVARWFMSGRQLGFARLSLALQQIVQYTAFKGETGDAARAIVNPYMAEARAFLMSATQIIPTSAQPPLRGLLGQDGASCVFPIAIGSQQAELHLAPTGMITQRGYRIVPVGPQPVPAPPALAPGPTSAAGTETVYEPAQNPQGRPGAGRA